MVTRSILRSNLGFSSLQKISFACSTYLKRCGKVESDLQHSVCTWTPYRIANEIKMWSVIYMRLDASIRFMNYLEFEWSLHTFKENSSSCLNKRVFRCQNQRMSNSLIWGQHFSISHLFLSVVFWLSAAILPWGKKLQYEGPKALKKKHLVIKLYCFHANMKPKANSSLTAI